MRGIRLLLLRSHHLLCVAPILILVTFAVVGGSTLLDSIDAQPPRSSGRLERETSADQFLAVLGLDHPTAKLDRIFRRWGEDKVFLFIAPRKEVLSGQVYYMMVYLAYPRRVSAVMCAPNHADAEEIHKELSPDIDGLIFFGIPPGRWSVDGYQIGAQLYITPYHGSPPWTSFCP